MQNIDVMYRLMCETKSRTRFVCARHAYMYIFFENIAYTDIIPMLMS